MGKTKTSAKNWTAPGVPLSQEEFSVMIRESEKGPFYSIDEVTKKISEWKLKYEK
ncbi:hypothetical protein [Dyadobacter sp.]|uniref:hypothetical protein n=1 Tax=Dyadobacter sp. TaxID=1914288 RepID=UPI003F716992